MPPKPTRPRRRAARRAYPTLTAWREAVNLNQREAARLLGFTQSMYARIELGKKIPVRDDLKRITRKTRVPIEVLVGAA